MTSLCGFISGDMQNPIWMFFIQFTSFPNCFRFKPQTKLHSHIMCHLGNLSNSSRKFFIIAFPISHGSIGCISLSKPPIIQYKQFYSCFCCQFHLTFQFIHRHITIHCFPGIQKNWSVLIYKLFRNQMLSIQSMKNVAHSI